MKKYKVAIKNKKDLAALVKERTEYLENLSDLEKKALLGPEYFEDKAPKVFIYDFRVMSDIELGEIIANLTPRDIMISDPPMPVEADFMDSCSIFGDDDQRASEKANHEKMKMLEEIYEDLEVVEARWRFIEKANGLAIKR